MFRGVNQHVMDAKNRVILPQKFRDELGKSFIITKGLDQCLYVYTMEQWEVYEAKAQGFSIADDEAREFLRFFLGSATECEPDGQGRIIIPPELKEYAGLIKEVVSVGMPGRIEIWSAENWRAVNDPTAKVAPHVKQKIASLGF